MGCCCCGTWPSHSICQRKSTRLICVWGTLLVWFCLTSFLVAVAVHSIAPPSISPDRDFPPKGKLEYGIRWYDKANVRVPGYDVPPPITDAPSLVFVHGWQPGAAQHQLMHNFDYRRFDSKYGVDAPLADQWLEAGWNVGVFYWTQFADEPDVHDAEAKIWTGQGPRDLRWRTTDGSFHPLLGVPRNWTVADLFVASYTKVFANATNHSHIRLAGHSLGSQVVTRATALLAERVHAGILPVALMPSRCALLDPFMSKVAVSYLASDSAQVEVGTEVTREGRETRDAEDEPTVMIGSRVVDLWVRTLSLFPDLVFSTFQSSDTNFITGNGNHPEYLALIKLTTIVRMYPGWISSLDFSKLRPEHVAAMPLFMQSLARVTVPSAGASDEDTRTAMGKGLIRQVEGRHTFSPLDDTFETTSWSKQKTFKGPSGWDFILVLITLVLLATCSLSVLLCCCCCVIRHRTCCCWRGSPGTLQQNGIYYKAIQEDA